MAAAVILTSGSYHGLQWWQAFVAEKNMMTLIVRPVHNTQCLCLFLFYSSSLDSVLTDRVLS